MTDFLEPQKRRRRKKPAWPMTGEEMLARVAAIAERRDAEWRAKLRRAARKSQAPARKARARRMKAAVAAKLAIAPRSEWKRRAGVLRYGAAPGFDLLLEAMVPGEWYARRDLIDLAARWDPPAPEGSVRMWVARLLKAGRIERGANADWDATRFAGRQSEPRWLYRRAAEAQDGRKGGGAQ